jgi:hypothetical protein
MRITVLLGVVLGVLLISLPRPCHARFASVGRDVPVERLTRNLERYAREHPREAQGYYTLGRVHSLAFSLGTGQVQVTGDGEDALPGFPPYQSIRAPRRPAGNLSAALRQHLEESVRSYRKAVSLDRENGLYWLGLGWMLEQGAAFADQVPAPFGEENAGKRLPAADWQAQALAAYRRAYRLAVRKDLAATGFGPGADYAISLEAGEGILRLPRQGERTPAETAEVREVENAVRTLKRKPRAITPIVFPLAAPAPLEALLAPGTTVSFDLAADGRAERWPWVKPETGVLVWDPSGIGRVTSGAQLFGSRTWQMFFRTGYEALAALDNDADGVLSGAELNGLAAWQDRNGNGASDAGEVRPLARLGITAVAVYPDGESSGVPFHQRGLRTADGTCLPTYDWTPVSLPASPLRARTRR